MAQDTRIGEVYVVRCLANDKEYVGQTIRGYLNRFKDHLAAARKGRDSPFYRAIRKYGPSQFSVEVMWRGPRSELNAAETRIIKERNSFLDTGNGYNLTTGGEQCAMSVEVCARISEISKRLWSDPSYRQKQAYTPERALMISNYAKSRAQKGEYQTLEARRKISQKLTELWKDPRRREEWSNTITRAWENPELRERMRVAMRKRNSDPSFKAASSAWQKARWEDQEYRKAMSAKLTEVRKKLCQDVTFRQKIVADMKRGQTPESRARNAEGIRLRWQDPAYRERMSAIRKESWALRKQRKKEQEEKLPQCPPVTTAGSGTTIKM